MHYLGAVVAIAVRRRSCGARGSAGHRGVGVEGGVGAGQDAAAYGGSKAAMMQAIRVAAVELGGDGIRVNAINADQVETPLFRSSCASGRRAGA